jgi:hypothetical protein
MKIQPEAHNAITLMLDDNSEFRLHNTTHGNKDRLFITNINGLILETMNPNNFEWTEIGETTMLRLTAKEKLHEQT